MLPFSITIITYNEEKNIGRCIDSVAGMTDDVVVVDSFSTDETEKICRNKNVHFYKNEFKGYLEQKNYAASLTKYDYVLSLDADEALSDDLRLAINDALQNPNAEGFSFNRLTNYCGKWIKHCGWYPDKKIRIYNKNKARWAGHRIHEYLQFGNDCKIEHLKGDLLHYSYYTISDHIQQSDKFTSIFALELYEKQKKITVIKIVFSPVIRFLRDYILKLGILDGYYGFIVCAISAHAAFLKYVKLKQIYQKGLESHE